MARGAVSRHTPRSPVTIGLIALVIILVGTFLGFTKDIPFTHGFQVKASFESANSIRVDSPVRIAGVNVGKVKQGRGRARAPTTSVVTLELNKQALPLHEDATAKIRPRIFLEGNFFVDLQPGTPSSPELDDGGVIKVTRTASPVQLDEVLTSLQSDTRQDLKDVLDGLAVGAQQEADGGRRQATPTPSARGETGAESFNDAYVDIPDAERSTAQVYEAFLGQEPGEDLSRLIDGTARTAGALIRNEEQLKDLITNFNTHDGGVRVASRTTCSASIRELAPTLENANGALASLNARVPADARVRARDPARRPRDAGDDRGVVPVDRADAQARLRGRARRARQGALAGHARPRAPDRRRDRPAARDDADLALRAPGAAADRRPRRSRTSSRPARRTTRSSSGRWSRLAGEGQNFDGNGMYVRFQTGGGSQAISMGTEGVGSGEVFGNNVAVPLGNRPFYPGKRPPYRPDVPCHTNKLPNVNGPAAAKTAPTRPTAQPSSTR